MFRRYTPKIHKPDLEKSSLEIMADWKAREGNHKEASSLYFQAACAYQHEKLIDGKPNAEAIRRCYDLHTTEMINSQGLE